MKSEPSLIRKMWASGPADASVIVVSHEAATRFINAGHHKLPEQNELNEKGQVSFYGWKMLVDGRVFGKEPADYYCFKQ